MADVLIVLVTLAFFAFGFFVMGRMDRYFLKEAAPSRESAQDRAKKDAGDCVLIVGQSSVNSELTLMLEAWQIPFLEVKEEQDIPFEQRFFCLLATDRDDYKNLCASAYCRRALKITQQVLLCNNRLYEPVFRKSGVPYITAADDLIVMLNAARHLEAVGV